MTDYNAITNATIDADSPITTQLMTYMRDNPIAITEGAAGAPLIQPAAADFLTLVPISNQTASASSTIDFTSGIDSTYKLYAIYLDKIRNTNSATNLWLRYSGDTGSTFYTTGYYDTPGTASALDIIHATAPSWAANTSVNVSGWVYIVNPSASLNISSYWNLNILTSSTAADTRITGGGHRNATTPVDAIRFLASTSTIASGGFYLYGVRLAT